MIQLLEYMEIPLRRMDENLRHIEDNLQGECLRTAKYIVAHHL